MTYWPTGGFPMRRVLSATAIALVSFVVAVLPSGGDSSRRASVVGPPGSTQAALTTTTQPAPATTTTTLAPPETTPRPTTAAPAPPATTQAPVVVTQWPASYQPCGGQLYPPCWVVGAESGGNYNAVSPSSFCGGRGCFGKWQFSGEWACKLGLPCDLRLATPEQQDEAARILWDGGRGCSNWNACG